MATSPNKPTTLPIGEGSGKGLKKKKSFQFKAFDKMRKLLKGGYRDQHDEDEPMTPSPTSSPPSISITQHRRHIVGSSNELTHGPVISTPTDESKHPVVRKISRSVENVFASVEDTQGTVQGHHLLAPRQHEPSSHLTNSFDRRRRGEHAIIKDHNEECFERKLSARQTDVKGGNYSLNDMPDYKATDKDGDEEKEGEEKERERQERIDNDDNDDGLPRSPLTQDAKNKRRPRNSPSHDSGHGMLSEDSSEDCLDDTDALSPKTASSRQKNSSKGISEKAAELDTLDLGEVQKLNVSAAKHRRNIRPTGRRAVTIIRATHIPEIFSPEVDLSFSAIDAGASALEASRGENTAKGGSEKKEEIVLAVAPKPKLQAAVRGSRGGQGEVGGMLKPEVRKNKFVPNLDEIRAKRRTIALVHSNVSPSGILGESMKEVPREGLKERRREELKETSKEISRSVAKEPAKEAVQEVSKAVLGQSSGSTTAYNETANKKEKSTDCDSALIPLLCVHG